MPDWFTEGGTYLLSKTKDNLWNDNINSKRRVEFIEQKTTKENNMAEKISSSRTKMITKNRWSKQKKNYG